jgi:hypothetical protein
LMLNSPSTKSIDSDTYSSDINETSYLPIGTKKKNFFFSFLIN